MGIPDGVVNGVGVMVDGTLFGVRVDVIVGTLFEVRVGVIVGTLFEVRVGIMVVDTRVGAKSINGILA